MQTTHPITDLTFLRPDGSSVRLADYRGQPLLLVFVRHLACIACRSRLHEIAKIYPQIRELGGEVLAVSFTPPERVSSFSQGLGLPFEMVSDPQLAGYKAFALGRVPVSKLFHPAVLARFVRMILRGWLPTMPGKGEDVLQLGGEFVIDADGNLVFAHPNSEPTDQASTQQLLAALRSTRPSA